MVQSKILLSKKSIEHYFLSAGEEEKKPFKDYIKRGISCQQIHQNKVKLAVKRKYYPGADGLVLSSPAGLVIRTADCLPVFFYPEKRKIIAALHAGWRGLLTGIIYNARQVMYDFDIDWRKTYVSIGPHIGSCCYRVDRSLIDRFRVMFKKMRNFYKIKDNAYYLDLSKVARFQLEEIGLLPEHIEDVNICTSCNRQYYSFRRDKTNKRNFNLLFLK